MVVGCGAPTRIISYSAPVHGMFCGGPCAFPFASNACMVNFAPGDAEELASTVRRSFVVLYSTRLTETVSDAVGFTVMTTVEGELEVPLLLVTINWNVRVAAGPGGTIGAVNVGLAAVLSDRLTAGPPVWVQANVSVDPPESLLPVPSRVTREFDATDWAGPALAVGNPGVGQFAVAGAAAPGHGFSCPTTGPEPFSGPEPAARNGKSSKLLGTTGVPTPAFSGNRNSKIGA